MPYQMKDGRWRAHRMIDGKRRTCVCSTKKEALAWESGQTKEKWEEEVKEQTPTVCLHDVATLYLDYSQSRHDKATYDAKKLAIKRLFRKVRPDTLPDELTSKDALRVIAQTAKDVSNAAANKDRKHLSAFWTHGRKYYGFPRLNPFQEVERLPENSEPHYVPPEEDFWKVYDAADETDKVILLAYLYTAGRRREILHLKWTDLNMARRKIRLSTHKTRDGSRKQVWLSMADPLHEALLQHMERTGMTGEYVFASKKTGEPYVDRKHFVTRLCERAGVQPRFNYHGIRGLTATILAHTPGVSLGDIQDILRHAQASTTDKYIRKLAVTTDRLSEVFGKRKTTLEVAASRVA